jgi:hypothetical protein
VTSALVEPLFHCPRPGDLGFQVWPDGVAVYDDSNGRVRALSPVAGEVLMGLIAKTRASCTDLALHLLQESVGEEDVVQMRALLSDLEALELVERLPG